jgi:hypothetical protein
MRRYDWSDLVVAIFAYEGIPLEPGDDPPDDLDEPPETPPDDRPDDPPDDPHDDPPEPGEGRRGLT